MSVVTMIKEIKEVHPEEIILVKMGNFFHVYGKDSYIISYLLGYKIRKIEGNIFTTGFPDKTEAKVKAMLEKNKINYLVVDRRNGYEVDELSNNKNLNKYNIKFKNAKDYIDAKIKIDKIYNYLINNISKNGISEKITEIERIINK